jgi:hypothetical protein
VGKKTCKMRERMLVLDSQFDGADERSIIKPTGRALHEPQLDSKALPVHPPTLHQSTAHIGRLVLGEKESRLFECMRGWRGRLTESGGTLACWKQPVISQRMVFLVVQ